MALLPSHLDGKYDLFSFLWNCVELLSVHVTKHYVLDCGIQTIIIVMQNCFSNTSIRGVPTNLFFFDYLK